MMQYVRFLCVVFFLKRNMTTTPKGLVCCRTVWTGMCLQYFALEAGHRKRARKTMESKHRSLKAGKISEAKNPRHLQLLRRYEVKGVRGCLRLKVVASQLGCSWMSGSSAFQLSRCTSTFRSFALASGRLSWGPPDGERETPR